MSDRRIEIAGWVGLGIGAAMGAAVMMLWPIGVLFIVIGSCAAIVAVLLESTL